MHMSEKIVTPVDDITEVEAREYAEDMAIIKDYTVYFAETRLGFTALVYKNGHHVRYADQYEIHFNYIKDRTHELLKIKYIDILGHKLFTDEEIAEPLKSYDDYTAKEYFLRNYHCMQVDYVSIFFINRGKEDEDRWKKSIKGLHRNPVSFCYMADKDFIKHEVELMSILEKRKSEVAENFEYQKSAFLHEMYNHEYGINWEADYDTLSAFGNLSFVNNENELESYFNQLGFNDIQRSAYLAARNEYFKKEAA